MIIHPIPQKKFCALLTNHTGYDIILIYAAEVEIKMTDNSNWLVYRVVRDEKLTSRARISELTGFSLMTIGKITDRLERERIIVRDRHRQTGTDLAGRRPSRYKLPDTPYVMLADMTKRPGSVGMYDVGGNSVGLTLTGNAGECAAELYSEHYEDIALTAVLVPDDGSDPVGVFPWKEPDTVVGVFTAAAWDAYEASGEKRTLFVRKEPDSEWRACLIADGKLRGLEHGGIETLTQVTGDIQRAVASLIVALSPESVTVEASDIDGGALIGYITGAVPCAPEIRVRRNDEARLGYGAAMLALYKHVMSIKKLP